ncbi:hypothetical protein LguiA_022747 [Lonicera macranthoides]
MTDKEREIYAKEVSKSKGADYVFKCIEKANHAVTAVETYYITFTATSAANSDCANTFQAMVHEGVIDTKPYICLGIMEMQKERLIFEGHIPSVHAICEAIEGNIYIEGILSDLKVASGDELMIYGLRTSGVKIAPVQGSQFDSLLNRQYLAKRGNLKLNTDGCSKGNPGTNGRGSIIRTPTSDLIGTIADYYIYIYIYILI